MDSLTAELARLEEIVKGMETRITKGSDGIESSGKERGQTEQHRDKIGEERSMRAGRAIARKTNGERTTENVTCRKVTGEEGVGRR